MITNKTFKLRTDKVNCSSKYRFYKDRHRADYEFVFHVFKMFFIRTGV